MGDDFPAFRWEEITAEIVLSHVNGLRLTEFLRFR